MGSFFTISNLQQIFPPKETSPDRMGRVFPCLPLKLLVWPRLQAAPGKSEAAKAAAAEIHG